MSLAVFMITGQSGSGKSTALRALEDEGFFCVDNLPTLLLEALILYATKQLKVSQLAIGMDIREPSFLTNAPILVRKLRRESTNLRLLFLEARESTVVRRYAQTRRKHPLDHKNGLREAIFHEQKLLEHLRELADDTLDTSLMSPHQLRDAIVQMLVTTTTTSGLSITLLSFGFKYGLPPEADMVFDARFLPNPYFDPLLQPQTGLDEQVYRFVTQDPETERFADYIKNILNYLVPAYQREGKRYLTVAIGCTGGQHRSVALIKFLEKNLKNLSIFLRHRDVHHAI